MYQRVHFVLKVTTAIMTTCEVLYKKLQTRGVLLLQK